MSTSSPGNAVGIRDEVAALKRERTITAAVTLFYERGYENTTLDAVAERLGVTKPFIYAHFASKGELLAEICSRGIAAALRAMEGALALPGAGPTEKLAELGRRFVTAVVENQKHIAIFAREEKNLAAADYDRIGGMRRDFDRRLAALLADGAATGEFRVDDVRLAALAIGGLVAWTYAWYRPDGRLTVAELAEEMSRLVLAVAQAGPAPSRVASPLRPGASRPARATTPRGGRR